MRKAILKTFLISSLLCVAGAAFTVSADAAQCRDAQGKFIKCPPPPAATTKCRDMTTKKFAKCGAKNTEPVPVKTN